jgi:hypothetical protein
VHVLLVNFRSKLTNVFSENSIFRWLDRHVIPRMVLVPWVVVTYRRPACGTNRGIRGNTNRSVVPDPVGATADGPTTTTNATDAAEASIL